MQKHLQLEYFAPVQLLPQHREVAVTRRVDELDGVLRAPDNNAVALLKVALQLPVKMEPRIDRALQGDFDHGAVADHDRPVGQRVRRSDVGHEAEAALVDAYERYVVSRQGSRRVEHASIASLHNDQVGAGADFIVVGYWETADAVGSRGFLLQQHCTPLPAQVLAHRGERGRDIGGVVAAYQGNGIESGHTVIKS